MKVHYQVATPEVTISPAVTSMQGDIYESIDFLADCGYDGVELMVRDVSLIDKDKILHYIMEEKKLDISMICTGEIYGEDKLTLTDPSKEVREKCIKRVMSLIDLASECKANINIGRVRGFYCKQISMEETDRLATEVFRQLADYAFDKNVELLIEPVTRLQTNYVNSTQDGIAFCKMVDKKNVNLMLDIYHMNIEDKNIHESLYEAKDFIRHMHFAENNRRIAGTCGMDFKSIIETLKNIGFDKAISFEIFQIPDSKTCAKNSIEYIRTLL